MSEPRDTPARAEVRAELRRLHDRSPAAFRAVLAELIHLAAGPAIGAAAGGDRARLEMGLAALEGAERRLLGRVLPPIETGGGTKPVQVDRRTLALLLGDYRNAQARTPKITRADFLDRLAAEGCRYGNRYVIGAWRSAEAIARHLKKAERLARSDPAFEAEAEGYRELLLEASAGSAGWK